MELSEKRNFRPENQLHARCVARGVSRGVVNVFEVDEREIGPT